MNLNGQSGLDNKRGNDRSFMRSSWSWVARTAWSPTAHPAEQLEANLDTETSVESHQKGIALAPSLGDTAEYFTADDAYAHATRKEVEIHDALLRLGYKGGYSIHAGFNEGMVHRGMKQEEMYLVLDSPVRCSSVNLSCTLKGIVAPYSAIIYTPQGIYRINTQPDVGKSKGILRGEDANDRIERGKAVGSRDEDSDKSGEGEAPNGSTGSSLSTRLSLRSTLSLRPSKDPETFSSKFAIASCIDITVSKGGKSGHPQPPESRGMSYWPWPWMSIKITRLDISAHSTSADLRFKYAIAAVQICAMSPVAPATFPDYSPFVVHAEEDTAVVSESWRTSGGIWGVITAIPKMLLCGTTHGTIRHTVEKRLRRWEVASRELWFTNPSSKGIVWRYFYHGSDEEFGPAVTARVEPKPKVLFPYKRLPDRKFEIEVEMAVYWSLNAVKNGHWCLHSTTSESRAVASFLPAIRRTEGSGEKMKPLPAFLNFLHRTSVAVDVRNPPASGVMPF